MSDECCGVNELGEIEDYQEFLEKVVSEERINLDEWVFQEVDLSEEPLERWEKYSLKGTWFGGCKFPKGVTIDSLRARGAIIMTNPPDLPYKPFRAFMYTTKE